MCKRDERKCWVCAMSMCTVHIVQVASMCHKRPDGTILKTSQLFHKELNWIRPIFDWRLNWMNMVFSSFIYTVKCEWVIPRNIEIAERLKRIKNVCRYIYMTHCVWCFVCFERGICNSNDDKTIMTHSLTFPLNSLKSLCQY